MFIDEYELPVQDETYTVKVYQPESIALQYHIYKGEERIGATSLTGQGNLENSVVALLKIVGAVKQHPFFLTFEAIHISFSDKVDSLAIAGNTWCDDNVIIELSDLDFNDTTAVVRAMTKEVEITDLSIFAALHPDVVVPVSLVDKNYIRPTGMVDFKSLEDDSIKADYNAFMDADARRRWFSSQSPIDLDFKSNFMDYFQCKGFNFYRTLGNPQTNGIEALHRTFNTKSVVTLDEDADLKYLVWTLSAEQLKELLTERGF